MSKQYRLMIYFAVATIHFYRKDIVVIRGSYTLKTFRDKNNAVLQRVFDEALSIFKYELSTEQMDRAIVAYLAPGLSVARTKVFEPKSAVGNEPAHRATADKEVSLDEIYAKGVPLFGMVW